MKKTIAQAFVETKNKGFGRGPNQNPSKGTKNGLNTKQILLALKALEPQLSENATRWLLESDITQEFFDEAVELLTAKGLVNPDGPDWEAEQDLLEQYFDPKIKVFSI